MRKILAKELKIKFIETLTEIYKSSGKTEFTSEELSFPYEDLNVKLQIYFSSINLYQNTFSTNYLTLIKFK